MTTEEIQNALDRIRNSGGDHEAAHAIEDRLYAEFIRYVFLSGDLALSSKAALVLSTKDMEFERWCA